MGKKQRLAALAAIGITGLGGLALQVGTSGASSSIAQAELRDASGNVVGEVVFKLREGEIVGQAEVLLPTSSGEFHGFHIHANDGLTGDLAGTGPATGAACAAPAFTSVGSHWKAAGQNHGGHTGDLPVLMRGPDGHAEAEFVVGKFEPGDIVGRAVVVHVGADNYANISTRYTSGGVPGPDATTLSNGDAGDRFACGVIEPRSG
ncbi:MAG: superoxide dismutase family protein [Acidimicrobiales bacterium]